MVISEMLFPDMALRGQVFLRVAFLESFFEKSSYRNRFPKKGSLSRKKTYIIYKNCQRRTSHFSMIVKSLKD